MNGWTGKVARINLTTGAVSKENVSPEIYQKYVGGSGLAAYFLAQELDFRADPLSPENLLIFSVGPLAATRIPTSSRYEVTARSPLTGVFAESDCGGAWGSELKMAGWDALIFQGKAPGPVYVWIADGNIQIRSAEKFWGKDTYELEDPIREETAKEAVVTAIGPAGENLVGIAAIMSDGPHGRAAGRAGVGAAMGSKNLKAIVVKGSGRTALADEARLKASLAEMAPKIVEATKRFREVGTSGGTAAFEQMGNLPIQNWRGGEWPEGSEKISGVKLAEDHLIDRYGCRGCIIRCGRTVKVRLGKEAGRPGGGPEYETVAALGSMCLVDDLESLIIGNELCNRYGLDTISTGSVIAFAMEAFEKGLISPSDTGGLRLNWGDSEVLIELIHSIGRNEGIGKLLGKGVRAAAAQLGPQAEAFAVHVKGLELPMHDPRAFNSLAVGYATSNRGACHLQSWQHLVERGTTLPELGYPEAPDRFGVDGKGVLTAKLGNLMSLFDSLKLCKFILFGTVKPTHMLEWYNAVTGAGLSMDEFMLRGERMFNLKRLINVQMGVSRADDTIPLRIATEKRGARDSGDNLPPFQHMLEEFYAYRGWDVQGRPTRKKLEQLGLADLRVAQGMPS